MKTRIWASALILFACMVNAGCKKTAVNSTGNNNVVPVPTPVGTPNGNPVTVTIGSNGGNIVSTDSALELQFPNGALNGNTQITIQPITNNAPNGLGSAYRFLPDGLKFTTPVNLLFHYTDEQIGGTISDLLGIAFQDTSGIWFGLESFIVDTINKTITAPINHFSDWAKFKAIILTPTVGQVRISRTLELTINGVTRKANDPWLGSLVPILPKIFQNQTWFVNGAKAGNATFGTILQVNGGGVYNAPSKVPYQNNPVLVIAHFNDIINYNQKSLQNLEAKAKIKIYDEQLFRLDIQDVQSYIDMGGMVYKDSASLFIRVKDSVITINKDSIQNFPPSVTPTPISDAYCNYAWVRKLVGSLNIQSGTGYVYIQQGSLRPVGVVNLINSGIAPYFSVFCHGTDVSGYGTPPVPKLQYQFYIQDSVEVLSGSLDAMHFWLTPYKNN